MRPVLVIAVLWQIGWHWQLPGLHSALSQSCVSSEMFCLGTDTLFKIPVPGKRFQLALPPMPLLGLLSVKSHSEGQNILWSAQYPPNLYLLPSHLLVTAGETTARPWQPCSPRCATALGHMRGIGGNKPSFPPSAFVGSSLAILFPVLAPISLLVSLWEIFSSALIPPFRFPVWNVRLSF